MDRHESLHSNYFYKIVLEAEWLKLRVDVRIQILYLKICLQIILSNEDKLIRNQIFRILQFVLVLNMPIDMEF
jgi:hypothetical protein